MYPDQAASCVPTEEPFVSESCFHCLQTLNLRCVTLRGTARDTTVRPGKKNGKQTLPCSQTYTVGNIINLELPWWLNGKESVCQCRRHAFNPLSRKIPYTVTQRSACTTTIEPLLNPCSRAWELQLLSPCAAVTEAPVP